MTDNYNCPLCDSRYERNHELSASNWECGSIKVDVGGTIFPTDLCNARKRIKELEKGLANTASYAKEYVKKYVECRDKLLEATKDLKDFGHDVCAKVYFKFLNNDES